MADLSHKCAIWDTPASPHYRAFASDPPAAWIEDSPRAGGAYAVHLPASGWVGRLDEPKRKRLTSWLINQRQQGEEFPIVTRGVLHRLESPMPLQIHVRADRLLRLLAQQSQAIGQQIAMALPNDDSVDPSRYETLDDVQDSVRNLWRAMAWSESTAIDEVVFLVDYLSELGWLKRDGRMQPESVSVTVEGFAHIEDSRVNSGRTQGFAAMWFADVMKEAYSEGIAPAIEDAGYSAMRIDHKEHVNKIDDEIIAEIRSSRSLVADFSQGEDGARGGVYFEAGFALGLGIPVIYTCRKGDIDKLHLDTRQYNHIVWETPEQLREALKNRILAVIGEGPGVSVS